MIDGCVNFFDPTLSCHAFILWYLTKKAIPKRVPVESYFADLQIWFHILFTYDIGIIVIKHK